MDEIKLKDRAVGVLDKALGLQAGHAHRLQLQTQAAEQQIAALRDAQRVGLNHIESNSTQNNAALIVSPTSSCLFKMHDKVSSHLFHVSVSLNLELSVEITDFLKVTFSSAIVTHQDYKPQVNLQT